MVQSFKRNMADRRDLRRFLLGLGLDGDGHARVTKGEGYLLVGGSRETHDRMQEEVERFRHALERRGTTIERASLREVAEAARESGLARKIQRSRRE
jgi:hypothetical protein